MIDLYYAPTPNGWKISIMLEECDLDYKVVPVNLGKGGQFKPDFLKISPNNRMPVIVDHTNIIEGEPLSVFESGAILMYLGEKTGKFFPQVSPDKERVLERFTRLDISRNTQGTGLGLSLVNSSIKFHKGSISLLDSNPNGLIVKLEIPKIN